jgi:CMP/dCMP kinase
MSAVPVVTIDGPSGSGKGTISRLLAARLDWHLLDSGALYRLVGLTARRADLDLGDAEALRAVAATMDVRFGSADDPAAVLLEGEDVTRELRTEEAGEAASRVAALPAVRTALLARQRAFARPPGLIADGRDMGTVVFPAAPVKVFLTASADERARRRYEQLKEQGLEVRLADLSGEIAQRDRRDAERTVSPLQPAADARLLDSTALPPEAVVARILGWVADAGIEAARA